MNFQETLDKLCLMAVVPHHPKCPAGMDSRLKCECAAGIVRLKVEGCRVVLSRMYETAVVAMAKASTTPTPPLPVKEVVIDSPPQNRRPVAVEGTAVPSRDTVPIIETPSFARGQMTQQETPPLHPPPSAAVPAAAAPLGVNGLPPGPRTAAVPITKRPK